MLYQPNFCCQCGAKIERSEWKLWTSRRFCENCEPDFRKEEWLPRIIIGIIGLFGLFGFGSYLKTPEKPLNTSANQITLSSSNKIQNSNKESSLINNSGANREQNAVVNRTLPNNVNAQVTQKSQNLPKLKETVKPQISVAEPVYFCGAQTKKGTPCTRRVKNSGRCWQHIGQPAMLPKEKLIVSQ